MSDMPASRALIAVDVEKFSEKTDEAQKKIRTAVAEVLRRALQIQGIEWETDIARVDDTGDGLIVTLHNDTTHLLVDAVHYVDRDLRRRERSQQGPIMRMRMAVHSGPVDPVDGSGSAKNELCRILDGTPVRTALRGTGSHVALVITDHVFRTAVRTGFTESVEPRDFHAQESEVKGTRLHTWVHVPGRDWTPAADRAAYPDGPDASGPVSGAAAVVPIQPSGGTTFGGIGTNNGNAAIGGTVNGGMHMRASGTTGQEQS